VEKDVASHSRPPPITPGVTNKSGSSKTPPSTTSRRETLQNLRKSASSPSGISTQQTAELRLVKELKKTQQEKEAAFRKVQRLQEQVAQLQKEESRVKELQTVLQLADKKGEAAAVKWARSQVSSSPTVSSMPSVSASCSFAVDVSLDIVR
jgi:hypothetical protein